MTKVAIHAEMADRWVPHFLGMLQSMQHHGEIGSSRMHHFYADGDGDFRPRFAWDVGHAPAPGVHDLTWDAG